MILGSVTKKNKGVDPTHKTVYIKPAKRVTYQHYADVVLIILKLILIKMLSRSAKEK
jgi:hypothetical protein